MTKELMYGFVSNRRPNPIGGNCYNCKYCYIHGLKGMKNRFPVMKEKYNGEFRLYRKYLDMRFKENEIIFFCDCIDWLHIDMPIIIIREILEWIERNPKTYFLSKTKNPRRYMEIIDEIPINMIIGFTCESNINYPEYSKAPPQYERLRFMYDIKQYLNNSRFLSIEPILKFTLEDFLSWIEGINPNFGIAMGYDNHKYKLDEPSLKDTMGLRDILKKKGYSVYDKTLRKAWWEE